MSQAQTEIKQDSVQTEADFSAGIVRDISRASIPDGGLYDAADYMLEQPGRAYKRGGWVRHSAALPAPPSAVATIHIPTRVVATSGPNLYDVTSENAPQATLVGPLTPPRENPANWIGNLIFCDPGIARRPKRVHPVGALGTITIDDVHATAPFAAYSAVYASRVLLARGDTATGSDYSDAPHKDRIWFSDLANPFTTWDTTNAYVDTSYEITGMAAIESKLLVFSPRFTERIIGGQPPGYGNENENMELQPVGGVGCLDARSICVFENQVIFGSQDGVFITNGVGFDNLMEKSDRSGILSFWRSLFMEHEVRSVVGGMLMRNYYMLSSRIVTETDERRTDFICYLPTRTWWRTTNTWSNMMSSGATEQETFETYSALAHDNYVVRLAPILSPTWANRKDGNDVPVEPMLETRMFGQGPGLKAYGFGRITRDLQVSASVQAQHWQASHAYVVGDLVFEQGAVFHVTGAGTSATIEPAWYTAPDVGDTVADGVVIWTNEGPRMQVSQATGIEAESYEQTVEGDLPPTDKADRTRLTLFRDSQSLSLRVTQKGPSEQTEVFLVEVESRPYELAADGD